MSISSDWLSESEAIALAGNSNTSSLAKMASQLRDSHHGDLITYSRKVFVPLTQLCRDVCHYCTFAQTPRHLNQAFMSPEEVLTLCQAGAEVGCQEALFTLGEKPELRYRAAREALADLGFDSTLEYVRAVAEKVLTETGLLPHINAGNMTAREIDMLKSVSASMGIMLESASPRLCQKGMPHYGSPDKDPELRLQTLELAGQASVPFTTGILIGIGETRLERIESLLAIRRLHEQYGHVQEVIIQNFRAKPHTKMAQAPEPDLEELIWTLAVTRLIFGPQMNIQAPPNLSPGVLPQLISGGINDWGGVSPVTPDHVNPEAPWPHLDNLAQQTQAAGKFLEQRLTVYPEYLRAGAQWLDGSVLPAAMTHSDSMGFARRDPWRPGSSAEIPALERGLCREQPGPSAPIASIIERAQQQQPLTEEDIESLFKVRGSDFSAVIRAADVIREEQCGDTVSYVVNRNINYTNVCYFRCQFCAFSKGKMSENLRGKPYDISAEEIARRAREAWDRGATEVCMQGGIHPDYTGQTYLDIVTTVKRAAPDIHVHAFSPLEVWQGAATLEVSLKEFLCRLKMAGLSTLPGTAAEILHDEIREQICADKLNTAQWLEVMRTAHEVGFQSTATIMFGHVDRPKHWAAHLHAIRKLQDESGGFTEFVPLPYVAAEAPMYRKGKSRLGPTLREALLMHAVPRLALNGAISNIQTSWVKMGREGAMLALQCGANDLGGSLMNESITRAAGAEHGQEWSPAEMATAISDLGRQAKMRTTLYGEAPAAQQERAFNAGALSQIINSDAGKFQTSKSLNDAQTSHCPAGQAR